MTSIVTNEDCMELMRRYPDKHFDLAVVDPPYGINVAKMAYTQEEKMLVNSWYVCTDTGVTSEDIDELKQQIIEGGAQEQFGMFIRRDIWQRIV